MDDDHEFRIRVLRELRHIKWLLAATFFVFLLSGAALVIGVTLLNNAVDEQAQDTTFQETAEELFVAGRIEQLRSAVSARLSERPNDVYALFYMAKVHLHAKEWAEALKVLERAQMLEPSWSDSLKPHIELAREGIAAGPE